MPPSASTAGGRRQARWSRESIIEKIQDWAELHGEPPTSADWNPSLARWRAQEWRIPRYRDGDWPSTNAVKRWFGGSFDAAVLCAGLTPRTPGPKRLAGSVAPASRVDGEPAEVAARLRTAEARAAHAERRADRAEGRLDELRRRARRATEQAGRARRARDRLREEESASARRAESISAEAEARVRAALDQAEAAARDAIDARRVARAAQGAAAAADARAEAALRLEAAAREELGRGKADAAWRAVRAAEARAQSAEARSRELAELVCGERRELTAAELAALRAGGPSGPTVLAARLRGLARARASGDRSALARALGEVASAAVRWRDSL